MIESRPIKISPSMLACDFSRMGEEAIRAEKGGAELLHLDVMDGLFVRNISFGAPVITRIRPLVSMVFDVHLMIERPYRYIADFAKAGADIITLHVEAEPDIDCTIDMIRSFGCIPALSIKPGTPAEAVFPYLERIGMVLVMTVEPGFGGQSFMYDMLPKIEAVAAEIRRRGLAVDVEVDGGISPETTGLTARAGANVFVAGNSIFSATDAGQVIASLRGAAEAAVK